MPSPRPTALVAAAPCAETSAALSAAESAPCNLMSSQPSPSRQIQPRSWAAVASHIDHNCPTPPKPYCHLPSVSLPPTPAVSSSPLAHDMHTASTLPKYTGNNLLIRTALAGVGPIRSLNPATGNPDPLPPQLCSLAFAPSSNEEEAFSSFSAARATLRLGAASSSLNLPFHVLIRCIGRWTYIYSPKPAIQDLLVILFHSRVLFPTLQVAATPLFETTAQLSPYAAAGAK